MGGKEDIRYGRGRNRISVGAALGAFNCIQHLFIIRCNKVGPYLPCGEFLQFGDDTVQRWAKKYANHR